MKHPFTLFRPGVILLCIGTLIGTASYSQEPFILAESYISQQIVLNKIPGIACCVVKDNQMIWSGAFGHANLESKIPMDTDLVMNIASISKTFTATAVMQLWEQGRIGLDADINDYLPITIRNPHQPDLPITLFQLLTHSSSIVDGANYDASYSDGDPVISLEQWITGYLLPGGSYYDAAQNFSVAEPGSQHEYSNVGYGLLGYLVEQISGMPFNLYCQQNILAPLDMNHSGWFLHEIDTSRHITPYEFKEGQNKALNLYSFPNYPDGLLRTSVSELSRFLMAIINGGSYEDARILKKTTLKKMLKLQLNGDQEQGLCWHLIPFESLWGHSGGDPGVATYMFFSPSTKIGVIAFQNNHNGDLFSIVRKLYSVADDL
jgi:CubicO group peptidase (beta-lactamase class C family)